MGVSAICAPTRSSGCTRSARGATTWCPSVYQSGLNPLLLRAEFELLPTVPRLGISFYAISPLVGGFFSRGVVDQIEGSPLPPPLPGLGNQDGLDDHPQESLRQRDIVAIAQRSDHGDSCIMARLETTMASSSELAVPSRSGRILMRV